MFPNGNKAAKRGILNRFITERDYPWNMSIFNLQIENRILERIS